MSSLLSETTSLQYQVSEKKTAIYFFPAGHGNPLQTMLAWRIPWKERGVAGHGPYSRKGPDMTEAT